MHEPEAGEESREAASSGHDAAIALMTSLQLCLATQDWVYCYFIRGRGSQAYILLGI